MKKIILFTLAAILVITMCACGNKEGTDKQNSSSPTQSAVQSPQKPTEAPGPTDEYEIPAGATEEISQGVFYYELLTLSGDPGEGLTPAEGAKKAEQLLISMNAFGDTGLPEEQCLYIAFDEMEILDSAMGREYYIYTVGTGTPEGGFQGTDYEAIYRVAVDYSGAKTASVYDDFSGAKETNTPAGEDITVIVDGSDISNKLQITEIDKVWYAEGETLIDAFGYKYEYTTDNDDIFDLLGNYDYETDSYWIDDEFKHFLDYNCVFVVDDTIDFFIPYILMMDTNEVWICYEVSVGTPYYKLITMTEAPHYVDGNVYIPIEAFAAMTQTNIEIIK